MTIQKANKFQGTTEVCKFGGQGNLSNCEIGLNSLTIWLIELNEGYFFTTGWKACLILWLLGYTFIHRSYLICLHIMFSWLDNLPYHTRILDYQVSKSLVMFALGKLHMLSGHVPSKDVRSVVVLFWKSIENIITCMHNKTRQVISCCIDSLLVLKIWMYFTNQQLFIAFLTMFWHQNLQYLYLPRFTLCSWHVFHGCRTSLSVAY